MQGLDYLHYNKALHGDLKPANLLLSSDRLVKIADFGSAMMYQESEGTWEGPVNGTPAFRPPETLTASGRLTRKVTITSPEMQCNTMLFGSAGPHTTAYATCIASTKCFEELVWHGLTRQPRHLCSSVACSIPHKIV